MLHIARVAWFTFYQAALSTLLALFIGLPAAFFCSRRKFPGRKVLLSLSIVPFCVPSLIVALGYVTFLGLNGGLNHLLMFIFGFKEPPVKFLYSFVGLIIAHGFYNFPIIMKNVSDAWERVPEEPAESARLLGAGEERIFRTVTIHQLIPSISSSCMLVFIYCFLSFMMVLLFGGIGNTTLEVEIYKAARATLDFKKAGLLALTETAILIFVTAAYCIVSQKATRANGISVSGFQKKKISGWKEITGFIIILLLILVFFIAPFAGIVINAFSSSKAGIGITLQTFARVLKMKSFLPSVKSTVLVSACTGFFCMVLGFLYSLLVKFTEKSTGSATKIFLNVFPMLPMAVSSVVVGMLIILLVKKGNVLCLVLAQTFLTWPLAFRVISPQLNKIQKDTLDSAIILSRNKFDMTVRVILPVMKKSLFSAFGFCFAVSAGDATLPLVLAIPKFDTLALFTYRLAGAYRFNEACASGVILGLICMIVFAFSAKGRK